MIVGEMLQKNAMMVIVSVVMDAEQIEVLLKMDMNVQLREHSVIKFAEILSLINLGLLTVLQDFILVKIEIILKRETT